MAEKNNMLSRINEREVVMVRTINAPQERLFRAWVEPFYLTQWWGPEGFTIPVCDIAPKQGGYYHIVMHSPDGIDLPLKGAYLEVEEYKQLVMTNETADMPKEWLELVNSYRNASNDEPAMCMIMTVDFEPLGEQTTITLTTNFETNEDRDAILKMGAIDGWAQSFDRLERAVTEDIAAY